MPGTGTIDEEVGSPVGHMVISFSADNFPLFIPHRQSGSETRTALELANVLCFCLTVTLIIASHSAHPRETEAVHTRLKSTFAVNNCARTLSKGNKRFDTITCVYHSVVVLPFPFSVSFVSLVLFSLSAIPLGSPFFSLAHCLRVLLLEFLEPMQLRLYSYSSSSVLLFTFNPLDERQIEQLSSYRRRAFLSMSYHSPLIHISLK